MGVIQNSVNQMLGMAAIGAKLSPGIQKQAEIRSELGSIKTAQQGNAIKLNAIAEDEKGYDELGLGVPEEEQAKYDTDKGKIYESQASLAEKKFNVEPSADNYAMMKAAQEKSEMWKEKAAQKLQQGDKLKQLKDMVKNYQTSLGTIGEINSASPKLAGQIAYQVPELRSAVAEYSKGANYGKK